MDNIISCIKYVFFKYLITDKRLIKIKFSRRLGKNVELENPIKFNDKLQWLKLYDRNPNYTKLVDKYEVRNFIKDKIGEKVLVPLLGVWDNFDEINFNQLPTQFVLKTSHDSGGVIICKDKKTFDINQAKNIINKSLRSNYYYRSREWPYKNIKPKIIAEKYMEDPPNKSLKDYKFMCFNGEPKIIQIMSDRTKNGFNIKHYDIEWNELNIQRKSVKINPDEIKKPKDLNRMLEIARILSENIPFVRVDLYYINGDIYFGELTFYPASGFMDFANEEDDYLLGSWIELSS